MQVWKIFTQEDRRAGVVLYFEIWFFAKSCCGTYFWGIFGMGEKYSFIHNPCKIWWFHPRDWKAVKTSASLGFYSFPIPWVESPYLTWLCMKESYILNLVFQCNFNAEKWENTFSPWCSHPVRGSNFCHFIFTDGALNALPYFSLNTSAFEKIAKWNFNIFILIYFFIKKPYWKK